MPIPNYQRFMYPLLEMAADGEAHSMDEAYEVLAEKFNLTEEDRAELLPSGRQSRYENRVRWARTLLQASVHSGVCRFRAYYCNSGFILSFPQKGVALFASKPLSAVPKTFRPAQL